MMAGYGPGPVRSHSSPTAPRPPRAHQRRPSRVSRPAPRRKPSSWQKGEDHQRLQAPRGETGALQAVEYQCDERQGPDEQPRRPLVGGVLHRRDHRLEQVDGEEPQGASPARLQPRSPRARRMPRPPPPARSSQTATNTTVGVSTRATRPAQGRVEPLVPGRRSASAFVKPAARRRRAASPGDPRQRMCPGRHLEDVAHPQAVAIGSRAAMVQCPSTTTTMLAASGQPAGRAQQGVAATRLRACQVCGRVDP